MVRRAWSLVDTRKNMYGYSAWSLVDTRRNMYGYLLAIVYSLLFSEHTSDLLTVVSLRPEAYPSIVSTWCLFQHCRINES